MKITNLLEQQDYVKQQTQKLQKLSDIGYYINSLIYNETTNIRRALEYTEVEVDPVYTKSLFEAIENYKTLLSDFGELK